MKSKRGQIFIITAIIIIIILVGLTGITNKTSFTQQPTKFFGLGTNLEREGYSLYDYGTYNKQNTQTVIQDFTSKFKDYIQLSGEKAEFAVIYGNKDSITLTIYGYSEAVGANAGQVNINAGIGVLGIISETTLKPTEDSYNFEFQGKTYNIPLTETEDFVFIFTKSDGFNKWTTTNI